MAILQVWRCYVGYAEGRVLHIRSLSLNYQSMFGLRSLRLDFRTESYLCHADYWQSGRYVRKARIYLPPDISSSDYEVVVK